MQKIGKLSMVTQKTQRHGSTAITGRTKSNDQTNPEAQMYVPTPTPKLTSSLSPQELTAHRANIGFEVEIILDGYWQSRPGDQVRAGILADWMDELQDWDIGQIRHALRRWRNLNPSKKPNPSHIGGILKKERGEAWVVQKDGGTPPALFAVKNVPALAAQ